MLQKWIEQVMEFFKMHVLDVINLFNEGQLMDVDENGLKMF